MNIATTEEGELILKYREGSTKALDEIFNNNQNLIYFVYQRHFSLSGCPKEDLCQEGNIGLFEAVKRFDPTKSDNFTSYKILWIKKRMYDFRRGFFKLRTEPLTSEHELIQYELPSSEKFRSAILELDRLVKCGKIHPDKARTILAKITKGTR